MLGFEHDCTGNSAYGSGLKNFNGHINMIILALCNAFCATFPVQFHYTLHVILMVRIWRQRIKITLKQLACRTAVLGNLQEFFSASVTCWIIHQPDGRVRKWDQIYFLLQSQVLITLIGKKDGLRFKGLGWNLRHLVQFSIWPWLSGYISAHFLCPLFFKMLGHSYTKLCRA